MVARVQINNKTGKEMSLLGVNTGYFYLMDRSTGESVGTATAILNMNQDPYVIKIGAGFVIKPRKSVAIWYYAYDYQLWTKYQSDPDRYYFALTLPIYAGGADTPASNNFGLGVTAKTVNPWQPAENNDTE